MGFHTDQEQKYVIYICFLNMARAGLLAFEFYDPNVNGAKRIRKKDLLLFFKYF
jgi:hypothetical protein